MAARSWRTRGTSNGQGVSFGRTTYGACGLVGYDACFTRRRSRVRSSACVENFCPTRLTARRYTGAQTLPPGWMAERSKAPVSGTGLFGGVGSNPTPISFLFLSAFLKSRTQKEGMPGAGGRNRKQKAVPRQAKLEYLGFDPSTSSLRRTRASDCANTPVHWGSMSHVDLRKPPEPQVRVTASTVPDSLGG